MTYREVAMWEILSVLRRIGRGESQAAVARTTGHGRKTVRRYVRLAAELGWSVNDGCILDRSNGLELDTFGSRQRPEAGAAEANANLAGPILIDYRGRRVVAAAAVGEPSVRDFERSRHPEAAGSFLPGAAGAFSRRNPPRQLNEYPPLSRL